MSHFRASSVGGVVIAEDGEGETWHLRRARRARSPNRDTDDHRVEGGLAMSSSRRVTPIAVVLTLILAAKSAARRSRRSRWPRSCASRSRLASRGGNSARDLRVVRAHFSGSRPRSTPGCRVRSPLGLHRVSLGTVLDAICESIQCSWTIEQEKELRVRPLSAEPARAKTPRGAWDRPLSARSPAHRSAM